MIWYTAKSFIANIPFTKADSKPNMLVRDHANYQKLNFHGALQIVDACNRAQVHPDRWIEETGLAENEVAFTLLLPIGQNYQLNARLFSLWKRRIGSECQLKMDDRTHTNDSANIAHQSSPLEMITHMTPTDLPYQKIDTLSNKEPEHARNSSASSHNIKEKSNLRQYYCQFDPKHRSGRSLVLKFDIFGNSYFEELSRMDVLRMTEEAAKEKESENECVHVVPIATSVSPRAGSRTFPRPQRSSNADRMDTALHAGICDVQRVHARDIRKLNNVYAVSNEPSIVLRKQAILVNADPIRALIMRDACLIFVPDGADSLLSLLKEKFHESNQEMSAQAFELRALEALLATLCRIFESDYEKMAPVVISALDRLANGKIGTNELDTLRTYKNTINEFESQVDGVRRALMEILDNEEDLRLLYLTKLHKTPSLLTDLWSFDSEEVEAMIENYLQDIYTTRTKANLMQHRIQNTESLVMMKLDYSRNYLLGVELLFSLVALGVSIGTYVTGIFGMNLASGIPEQPVYFYGTVVVTGIAIIVIVVAGVFFFRRQGVYL